MVILSQTERDDISKIFNDVFKKYGLPLNLNCDDIHPHCLSRVMDIDEASNPIFLHLRKLNPKQTRSTSFYYHFKSTTRAIDILAKSDIQASSLASNSENDFSEYSEYFRRLGKIHPFTTDNPIAKGFYFDSSGKSRIDISRENAFILCFTNGFTEPRFWKEYVNDDNGVCLKFKFNFKISPLPLGFDFRDVFYDSGYDLDFINEISHILRLKHKLAISPSGFTKFSLHYKRAKYNWENETRISFQYENNPILPTVFPINTDPVSGRKFISIPSVNSVMEWKIEEVICGKKLTSTDIANVSKAGLLHNPDIIVRNR